MTSVGCAGRGSGLVLSSPRFRSSRTSAADASHPPVLTKPGQTRFTRTGGTSVMAEAAQRAVYRRRPLPARASPCAGHGDHAVGQGGRPSGSRCLLRASRQRGPPRTGRRPSTPPRGGRCRRAPGSVARPVSGARHTWSRRPLLSRCAEVTSRIATTATATATVPVVGVCCREDVDESALAGASAPATPGIALAQVQVRAADRAHGRRGHGRATCGAHRLGRRRSPVTRRGSDEGTERARRRPSCSSLLRVPRP